MSKTAVYKHSSWEEFLEQALHGKPQGEMEQRTRVSRINHKKETWDDGKEFYGVDCWEETVELVEKGWEEGREMMDQILSEVSITESRIPKKRVIFDVEGDTVDVGRFVSGEPECMMRWGKRPTATRRCKMLINMSVSSGVSQETIKWKGACLLALVDRLEATGVRCEVDLGFCIRNYGYDVWAETVTIKELGEPLHLDRMAFLMVHPASYRSLFFSYQEASPLRNSKGGLMPYVIGCYKGGDYGVPVKDMTPYLPEGTEPYDLVMEGFHFFQMQEAITKMEQLFAQVCGTKDQYEDREETFA